MVDTLSLRINNYVPCDYKSMSRFARPYNTDLIRLSRPSYSSSSLPELTFKVKSVPKFIMSNNLTSLTLDEFKEVINKLNKKLLELGISTNLLEAHLYQLHFFKNILLDHNYSDYIPIFEHLIVSGRRKFKYGTSYYYGSTNEKICFYDKISQLKSKGIIINADKDILRVEIKLEKSSNIREKLNIQTLGELINEYNNLPELYSNILRKKIFNNNHFEINIHERDKVAAEVKVFQRDGSKQYLNNYLQHKLLFLLADNIFLDEYKGYLLTNNKSCYALEKKIDRACEVFTLLEKTEEGIPLYHLFQELKSKLLENELVPTLEAIS